MSRRDARLWLALGLAGLALRAARATDAEGTAWLAENAKKPDVVTLESGVQYKIINKGKGTTPIDLYTTAWCAYDGKLLDGDVFINSSWAGESSPWEPISVIKGWREVMQLMVEGDFWEIYVPSELGYGKNGFQRKDAIPNVPPNSLLITRLYIVSTEKITECEIDAGGTNCSPEELKFVSKHIPKPERQSRYQRTRAPVGLDMINTKALEAEIWKYLGYRGPLSTGQMLRDPETNELYKPVVQFKRELILLWKLKIVADQKIKEGKDALLKYLDEKKLEAKAKGLGAQPGPQGKNAGKFARASAAGSGDGMTFVQRMAMYVYDNVFGGGSADRVGAAMGEF